MSSATRIFLLPVLTVLSGCVISSWGQLPNLSGQGQGQCEYHFTVSSPVDCSHTDPALQRAVELIKRDTDRSRLDFVAQNSAVQMQMSRLKMFLNQVDTELDTVKTQLAANLSGGLVNVRDFNKLKDEIYDLNIVIVNIRDNIDRQISFLQSYLARVNATLLSEQVERFKIEAGLQAQVNSQNTTIADMEKRLQQLEKALASSGTSKTNTTTPSLSNTAAAGGSATTSSPSLNSSSQSASLPSVSSSGSSPLPTSASTQRP